MSAPVSFSSLHTDGTNALRVVASDGREVVVTKQEIQNWYRDTRPAPTIDQGAKWVGDTVTARWNALPGVVQLRFHFKVFSINPLDFSYLVASPLYTPPDNWWVRPIPRT